MLQLRSAGTLGLLLAVGCSCGAPAQTRTPPHTAPTTGSAGYEVHEWGLLRADPGDVLRVGAVAPPISFSALVVEKPVLYFHASAPLTLASVSVDVPAGAVTETWPFVALGPSVRWPSVAIDPAGACSPSPLPTPSDAPCSTLAAGEACEASGLEVVRTSDAACVTTGGTSDGFLFYRARADRFVPPLRFERTAGSGDVVVTNESDASIPGVLVRIWASPAGTTQTLTAAPPAPHASVTVGDDFAAAEHAVERSPAPGAEEAPAPSMLDAGRRGLRDTVLGLGLSEPEADVFLAAWSDALFGRPGEIALEGVPGTVVRESFVYFLPEALDDDIARLTFDPPPAAVHRAMAVWSVLPASGSSH